MDIFALLIRGVVAGGRLLTLSSLSTLQLLRDLGHREVPVGCQLGGTRDDEWGARFVDEDTIDLIDDGVVQRCILA